jgi:hypothetical protein
MLWCHPMRRSFLGCSLLMIAFTGSAIGQSASPLPQGTSGAFDGNMFKNQGNGPPANPTSTLMGEAPPPLKIWNGSMEFGINGQSGNTEVVNLRTGFNLRRKTDENLFTTDLLYALSRQEGLTTQNQMLFNARDEILMPGSPWSLFASTNVEFDEFRAYDFLIGVYGGMGYTFIDDGSTLFKIRAGAGAVRRVGGPDERWEPEAIFGYDFNKRFTDRQSFIHSLDYYPRIDQPSQFRVRARAAYEIIVDPATCTALRFGIQNRYDSHPGLNTKRNDINYFASLVIFF